MHKAKIISGVLICFLIFSSLFFISNTKTVKASENWIYVDASQRYPDQADGSEYNPYRTIQNAIDAASDGDIIKVLPGDHGGDILIDKSITLTNENRSVTVLSSGAKTPYMIEITASSVSLEGFTINDTTSTSHRKAIIHIAPDANDVTIVNNLINRSAIAYVIYIEGADNSIIKNNTVQNGSRGIKIENSNSNSIHENHIENCTSDPAIQLISSSNNIIEGNIMRNSEYGITAKDSSNNIIKNNTIYENSKSGIVITTGNSNSIENNSIYTHTNGNGIDLSSPNNYILSNAIYNNNVGVRLGGSYCNVTNCTIYSSSTYGIYAIPGGHDNKIFNNTFRDNTVYHAKDDGNNQWDDGTIGNYWDDFYGPDPNNALCILPPGSEAYSYTKGGVSDNYPKGIFNIPPVISNPDPGNLEEQVSRQPILKVDVVDPDPAIYKERMDVHFYYVGLDGSHNYIGTHQNVESGGTASKWFSSTGGENPAYSYKGLGYDYVGIWYVEVEEQYYKNTSGQWIFSTMNIPVTNQKPIVEIVAPADVQLGDSISFDGSGCNDTDGEIVFYRWSFGDDTNVINEVSPTHIYQSAGEYNVSLIVIDNNGASSIAETKITITQNTNRAPIPVINGPYTGTAGKSISFSSAGSSDPDIGDSIVTYTWSFDDGSISIDQNPSHIYSIAGNYTVTLTVEDSEGATEPISTYALIKASSDSEGTPGFEITFVFIALFLILIIKKKNWF